MKSTAQRHLSPYRDPSAYLSAGHSLAAMGLHRMLTCTRGLFIGLRELNPLSSAVLPDPLDMEPGL